MDVVEAAHVKTEAHDGHAMMVGLDGHAKKEVRENCDTHAKIRHPECQSWKFEKIRMRSFQSYSHIPAPHSTWSKTSIPWEGESCVPF